MSLRVLNVGVGGFGPLRSLEVGFNDDVNCIIGPNGCGKSTLLQLIAGICGTDEATVLIANQKVSYCELVVDLDNTEHVFSITDCFDEYAIMDFKMKLHQRVSFPLTQYRESFISECVEIATAADRFNRYCDVIGVDPAFLYTPSERTAQFTSGDGVMNAFSLILADSPKGVPAMFDGPERHLHLISQRTLLDVLTVEEHQVFYSTHSPDMVWRNDELIELGNAGE